jgi:hypothetical protein
LENQRFIGRSPRAGGEVNPESHFPPATDPEVLPHTHGHAEQSIADQLEAALEKIPVEQLKGRRVYMLIEQEPCSTCAQGVNNLETEAGVLVRLSKRFPEVIFEVRSLDSSAIIVLQNGVRVGGGAAGGAAKGTPNAGEPVQVETQIEVLDAVTHPDGSVTSQIEYKFGQNLENINKGAPPGGELPAKIVVKVTQNADGSIASVESLSGQPQALAEALVRQTLPDALAGAETGAAEGALEGAVAKAAVLAKVSKGLKIGGWAAFVVITGYQLITATPEERPRVVTAAAGGLAGGVVGSYVVCNLIFGLETLGWSLLFCGLVAGGAGGYVGSEVAGDIYDEATRTKLQEALQKLDASPRNVRILFNAVVNRLGPDGLPIDDSFVNRFLAIVPSDLRNYELIVLAGRFAAAAGVRAPKQPTAAQKAATHAPTTSFPTFTQRSDCKVNCHRGADDLRGFDVIDGRPVFSAEDFANMEKWIESQPQVTPDNEDVGPKGKPAPKSHEGEVHLPTPGSGYPSMKDQAGTCPGGCHKPASALSRPKINIKPEDFENIRNRPSPRSIQEKALNALAQAIAQLPERKKATRDEELFGPQPAPHPTTGPLDFPNEWEQRGTVCPNCHRPNAPKNEPFHKPDLANENRDAITNYITEAKTVLLEMGRDGKFSAKSNAWEDNKVIPEGAELVIKVKGAAGSSRSGRLRSRWSVPAPLPRPAL